MPNAEGSPYANEGGVLYKGTLLEKQLDKELTSVTVREGTTEIADKTFMNSNIATVILPDSVTKIGAGAFCNTKITTIDLSQVTAIGQEAFKSCSALATVQWPTNITELELATFQNCTSLTTVELPNTLTTLGKNVFRDCTALTTVEFPTSLTTLGESAFVNCTSLKEVTIPEGVSEIPKQTFAKCIGLESITLPKGLTTIGEQAFFLNIKESEKWTNPNPKLTAINIPASVTSVGKNFLAGVQADGKTALIFEGEKPPTFASDALAGISGDSANKPTVYYPAEAEDAYTEATGDLVTGGLVTKPSEGNPPDTQYALAIDEETLSLKEGNTKALTVEKTVPNGATLEWASSNNDVATVQDGTVTAVKEGTATISASIVLNGATLATDACTVTVTSKSTGGGTVVKRYDVTLADTDNGTITATHKRASKNSTVTITATPADGYVVDAVTVTEKDGDKVEVTKKDDNKYTFKMPASDVTVKATFKVAPTEPEQPSGLPFTDVAKDAWYFPAVEYVFNNGLMNGTTATTFAPNVNLNRAMMAAVLYNMEGQPACDKSGLFSDVADGKWYTDAVNWAASNNIVSGMPDGTYAPDQALTREQMASILYRYAEYKGIDVSSRADLSTFTDGTTVSPWAQDVVQWAVAEKLMSGNGNELQPKGTASRAQVATVLMNYCENVAK